ncbi:hypothetical protein [Roseomonas sp. WA12]
MRLAFRLALLDAIPPDGSIAQRCAALEVARDRLGAFLVADANANALPSILHGIRDRAVLAAALEGGFEEAWAVVTSRPW